MALLAGSIAAILGFAELALSLPKNRPLSIHAWRWVLARLTADFAVAVIAFPLVDATGASGSALITAIIAAGSGSVLLRTQVSVARRGESKAPIGLTVVYDLLRKRSSERIGSINAAAQTDWLVSDVLPCLRALDNGQLRQRALIYVKTLPTKKQQTQSEAFIETAFSSTLTADEQRLNLAQHLIDIEGRDMVKSLMKTGRQIAAEPSV